MDSAVIIDKKLSILFSLMSELVMLFWGTVNQDFSIATTCFVSVSYP
jgi:hypothetical protein